MRATTDTVDNPSSPQEDDDSASQLPPPPLGEIFDAASRNNQSVLSLASRDLQSVDIRIPRAMITSMASALRTLDLSRNRLTELPSSVCQLTGLASLDVSRNRLRGLPAEIGRLTGLVKFVALSNHIRPRLLPIPELASLPALKLVDLRYNPKIKEAARADLASRLGAGLELKVTVPSEASAGPKLSAADRDPSQLRSQLEPISTPQLRKRLLRTFGVTSDPAEDGREEVMQRLLACYEGSPRTVRHERGEQLRAETVEALVAEMEAIRWPGTTRERPKISAERYMILQRPGTVGSNPGSAKSKREGAKLRRYRGIWDKAAEAVAEVDPEFAKRYTALAVTCNFRGSPHIDTLNVAPFYGLSLGNFSKGGGKICVECSATEVAEVDTCGRLAKVDGRFPHWVTPYKGGPRYSLIYYVTSGEVVPQTTAVFQPREREEGAKPWVPPPSFVL